MDFSRLSDIYDAYPMHNDYTPKYGTSGYRADAKLLDAIVIRCSVLMTLRSKQIGKHCGMMITASHNPANDNGLKLIDYTGDMIDERFEEYAIQLADCNTFEDFKTLITKIVTECNININDYKGYVIIGQDTRTSGDYLVELCKRTIVAIGGKYITVGKVTTPELHYNVASANLNKRSAYKRLPYIYNLILAFKKLYNVVHQLEVHVDCANGVGAVRMKEIAKLLEPCDIQMILYNTSVDNLNHLCGADYVEKTLTFPTGMQDITENSICCSLDGDADRIVFFSKNNNKFVLLNGDKIACLILRYLYDTQDNIQNDMNMCVVHTPYANGAFLNNIKDNYPEVHITCAETGVKHLHRTAKQYDIGVYFESNGHGSVHFSDECLKRKTIQTVSNLLSQYTGDAVGNLLFVLVALQNISFLEWMYMYQDFPCKQVKLYGDKTMFQTTDFGRKLVHPEGLQLKINEIMSRNPHTNCFVRPSGTEDLLRLYVECTDEKQIDGIVDKTINVISTYTYVKTM